MEECVIKGLAFLYPEASIIPVVHALTY